MVWHDLPHLTAPSEVLLRRFDNDGAPLGGVFLVSTEDNGFGLDPAIGMHPSGEFVVVWGNPEIGGRRYLSGCAIPGVEDLQVVPMNGGSSLHLTWANAIHAEDYVVFEDVAADGSFAVQAGTASSGAAGLILPSAGGDAFFLVAGRNAACGLGPWN